MKRVILTYYVERFSLFLLFINKQLISHLSSIFNNYKCSTRNSLDLYHCTIFLVYCYDTMILYHLNTPMNCSKKDFLGIPEIQK